MGAIAIFSRPIFGRSRKNFQSNSKFEGGGGASKTFVEANFCMSCVPYFLDLLLLAWAALDSDHILSYKRFWLPQIQCQINIIIRTGSGTVAAAFITSCFTQHIVFDVTLFVLIVNWFTKNSLLKVLASYCCWFQFIYSCLWVVIGNHFDLFFLNFFLAW